MRAAATECGSDLPRHASDLRSTCFPGRLRTVDPHLRSECSATTPILVAVWLAFPRPSAHPPPPYGLRPRYIGLERGHAADQSRVIGPPTSLRDHQRPRPASGQSVPELWRGRSPLAGSDPNLG